MLEIPAKLDLERPKRPRTVFTDEQLEKLEHAFNNSGYLSGATRAKLAESLGLSDNQVKVWFQNRRTKQKKSELKEPEKSTGGAAKTVSPSLAEFQIQNYYQTFWNTAFRIIPS
uniref:Homeobox domain-containing protein n=1 Tax=Caenorhabditis japonica TaxID=281687 RepID=A0A8R1HZY9_CAEJA